MSLSLEQLGLDPPSWIREVASRLPARMTGWVDSYSVELHKRLAVYEIRVRSYQDEDAPVRPPHDFLFRSEHPDLDWDMRGPADKVLPVELKLVLPRFVVEHVDVFSRGRYLTVGGVWAVRFLHDRPPGAGPQSRFCHEESDTPLIVEAAR